MAWRALCEPDASLRTLLSEWLQRATLEPLPCDTALTGRARVLVIADVHAPRHDGAARIARLRQRFPGAKVLAISAQFMPAMCAPRLRRSSSARMPCWPSPLRSSRYRRGARPDGVARAGCARRHR